MNTVSKDKRTFHWKRLTASHQFALQGIRLAMDEPNFRFHMAAAVIAILMGMWLSLTKMEWVLVLFLVFGMFILEIINTAIEKTVDLVTEEYHPLAKQAKDLAAGAVLLYAFLSVIVGLIIFIPKLMELFLKI
ncbi:diacylglycerol kinase family protein [Bacillus sp. FJAT-52991]|uniref:Diacylglycerol kinase family protein n=1 Tax=Bacillus kandeliae TaxID=3129297 RepID=A0ABZ2N2X9_9BACI